MKLSAETLKASLKRLVSAENVIFQDGFLFSQDQELVTRTNGFDLGTFSVASKTLNQIASRLTGEVTLEYTDPILLVKSGRSRFKLNTMKAETPKIPEVLTSFSTSLPELKKALTYATQATENSMKFSYQGSVLLSGKRTVSTDGFRLALYDLPTDMGGYDPKSPRPLLIPSRAAGLICNMEGDQLVIGESESALTFSTPEVTLSSSKLAKSFCNFEHVIPKNPPFNCILKAEELKNSLQRVAPMAGQTKVRMVFNNGICVLSATDTMGTADDELSYEGDLLDPPMETVLNHLHLSDFVSGVTGGVKFGASDRQAILQSGPKTLVMVALRR